MSQAKVDRNKQLKRNRKKIVKREHRREKVAAVVGIIVAILLLIWLGFSISQQVEKHHEANPSTVKVDIKDIFNFDVDAD